MSELDKLILNALDRQRISASNYSFILDRLDNSEKKLEFLNYLNENRKVILSSSDIILRLKEIVD